jgi:RES domain-containing protein
VKHVRRGGEYYRVCDPSWTDPSDTSYSKQKGGRWNPPDAALRPGFGALYLNASIDVARENVHRHIRSLFGAAATIDDLNPAVLPDLQHYEVTEEEFLDAVTPAGIAMLGLAATYPIDIPHPPCQGIAAAAYAAGDHGVAALSAVAPAEEELVIFDRSVPALVAKHNRQAFADWFGP